MNTEIKNYLNNDIHERIETHSIYNLTKLNFMYIVNSWKTMGHLIFFLVFSLTIPTIFVAYRSCGGALWIFGVIAPSLIVMGNISYGMKKSSLYSNMRTSGFRMRDFYLPTLITMFLVQLIMVLLIFPSLWIFGRFGWLMIEFNVLGQNDPRAVVNIFNFTVIVGLVYCLLLSTLISFSFYFVFHNLISTSKGYYAVVMATLIIGIIFGGSVNSYFSHPIGYHDVYSNYNIFDNVFKRYYKTHEFWITFAPQSVYDVMSSGDVKPYGQHFSQGLFPKYMFFPTLFYPFFGIGQFATSAIGEFPFHFQYRYQWQLIVPDAMYNLKGAGIMQLIYDNWNTDLNTTLDILGITLVEPYKDGFQLRHLFGVGFDKEHIMWTLTLIQPYITTIIFFFIGTMIAKVKDGK